MHTMAKKSTSQKVFQGILTPSGWDEKGNILSISIQTTDEKEYHIEKSPMENELRSYINEKIEVMGKVRERIDGKKYLFVRQYKLVDQYVERKINAEKG